MSIHAALTHRTSYSYDHPIALGPQTVRLRPAPHARTPIISYSLKVEPKPHFLNWQQDPQGNFLARIVFPDKVTHFDVTVDLVADMATINPFDFFLEPEAEAFPFTYDPVLEQELAPFRLATESGPHLTALLAEIPKTSERTIDLLVSINRMVQERVSYIVRLEAGVWSPEETLSHGKGSCRDSAWVLVQLMRGLGLAARFVSGYLIQLVADVKPLQGPEGPTSDFTDLHAWAEVYLPGAGWVGFDATSGLMTGEGHIPLAASPAPQSAAPISGLAEKSEVTFAFDMEVKRISETPRVTKPYRPEVWQDLLAAGARVDRALAAGSVCLTMGGEPTFVAASDFEAAEWNADALGPTKRDFAGKLMRRLAALWAPGAVLQYTTGKHYPGEQLPRWALSAHWRRDGEPIWADPSLMANPDNDTDTATEVEAESFCRALAERLQVDPGLSQQAYEDIHYYLWKEHRLPANVVAEDAKLRDPMERERMARVFSRTLARPAGSVLPIRRVESGGGRRWQSGRWFVRGEHLFLVPGDSAIGARLPLESLPWADPDSIEYSVARDPFSTAPALPPRQTFVQGAPAAVDNSAYEPVPQHLYDVKPSSSGAVPFGSRSSGGGTAPTADGTGIGTLDRPVVGREEPGLVRTALCVEARNGLLHVYLPPLYEAVDFLDLVAAVEQTAAESGRKVVIEGYPPPDDDRLANFSVTPDPGVIEVNIQPSESWAVHVERTEQLYEEARQVGLATEKFMLDGRHIGTGGGNHVVMGAAHAADSPFLRRPDLLKSLLSFWQNHPSLSFLFSGLFIGPSSQHPRIDEARSDSLNELDIAFSQITPFSRTPPWLVDRLFRNLLADMTGNTHRTEFCIDKMYDPNQASGRRGLVEFRAFEMPPHAQMSLAQMLLMRSAVAAFWQRPYERPLTRWDTRLHDDFMLPHYVEQDFGEALDDLRAFGFGLDRAWFEPHFEFRFPKIGEVDVRGINVELRYALEPWHVLGEDPAAGGTVRYVDSSAERLQVRTRFWEQERFVLACNGIAIPLSHTDTAGEFIGAVRFKAWAAPSSLHPTIPAQTPLVFDIHDKWTGRSIGGMTHHVAHPGGRSYATFPVNANEAEARRRSRFFPIGHTAGPRQIQPAVISQEHPRTLDLRRFA